jgi:hypothetical protein
MAEIQCIFGNLVDIQAKVHGTQNIKISLLLFTYLQ